MRKQKSSFGRIAEHVLGYSNKAEKPNLPPGYTICYSRNGHPYLMKLADESSDAADAEAANEHKRILYPLSVSKEVLGNRFGVGVYLYFDFLIFLIGTNAILLLLGLISFAIHTNQDTWAKESELYGRFGFFFYDKDVWDKSHTQWMWINVVAVLCWFFFGPFYSYRIRRYFKQREQANGDSVDLVEINLEEYIDAEDFIKVNERVTTSERRYRILAGYIVFVLVLVMSSVVSFFLVLVSSSRQIQNLDSTSILLSAIIAVFITMVNMVWKRVCVFLTRMEKHETWTKFRQHNTLKFFLFKMLNVLSMYASRVLVPRLCHSIPGITEYCTNSSTCKTSSVGVQLLFLLVFDLTVQNLWEISFGLFRAKVNERRGMMGKGSNDSVRPEFDVAEEYLEVMYRQFIIYLAFPIFPLVAALGLVCNVVEYRVDKYRLLRICQHPRGLQGSMRNFLTFFLFCTAAVALASPPYGASWVMSGQSQSICNYNITTTPTTM